PIAGTADFYAWGLESANDKLGQFDVRAAGVQSFPTTTDATLVFAVNTFKAWTSPETVQFDFLIDSNGDGNPDFAVFNYDFGLLQTGSFNGQIVSVVQNL